MILAQIFNSSAAEIIAGAGAVLFWLRVEHRLTRHISHRANEWSGRHALRGHFDWHDLLVVLGRLESLI